MSTECFFVEDCVLNKSRVRSKRCKAKKIKLKQEKPHSSHAVKRAKKKCSENKKIRQAYNKAIGSSKQKKHMLPWILAKELPFCKKQDCLGLMDEMCEIDEVEELLDSIKITLPESVLKPHIVKLECSSPCSVVDLVATHEYVFLFLFSLLFLFLFSLLKLK